MTLDLDRLEALAKAAPQGKWEIWTSNSWRRVIAKQGRKNQPVIEPTSCRLWGDLAFGFGVEAWLEGFTPEVALALIAEVRALRGVCAAAYQLAGTMNAPVRFLDALSDASNGETEARAKTDDLLPVSPDEVGSFLSDEGQEYREDAERYRFARESIQESYALPGGFYLSESGGESWDKTIDAARREKE